LTRGGEKIRTWGGGKQRAFRESGLKKINKTGWGVLRSRESQRCVGKVRGRKGERLVLVRNVEGLFTLQKKSYQPRRTRVENWEDKRKKCGVRVGETPSHLQQEGILRHKGISHQGMKTTYGLRNLRKMGRVIHPLELN